MDERRKQEYLERPWWSIHELSVLLLGLDPFAPLVGRKVIEAYQKAYDIVKQALAVGELTRIYNDDEERGVRSKDAIHWARGREAQFPKFSFHVSEASEPETTTAAVDAEAKRLLKKSVWSGYDVVDLLQGRSRRVSLKRVAGVSLIEAAFADGLREHAPKKHTVQEDFKERGNRLVLEELRKEVIGEALQAKDKSNPDAGEWLFVPADVIRWAVSNKEEYPGFPFTLEDLKDCVGHEPPEKEAGAVGAGDTAETEGAQSGDTYPWGDYTTKKLELVFTAIEEWWSEYDPKDPKTAPTNAEVSSWLVGQGMVKRTAEEVAKILRADDLPYVRRK